MRTTTRGPALADFADCLLTGLLIALAAVPLVTAPPAFAAGCRAIRRSADGIARPLWTTFWADFRALARGGTGFGALTVAAVVLLGAELSLELPGAALLRPLLALVLAAVVVVAVRTCEVVERDWRRAVVAAARDVVARPGPALLTAVAVVAAAVLVWMQPLLAGIAGGPMALAAVATRARR